MLARKISEAPVKISRLKAFSLVELLISLALGSILLLSFTYYYSNYYVVWQKQKEQFFLQKEAHQLAHYLQQHIQHLGYQGNNKEESNFELFEKDNQRFALNSQCLIFFYDLNGDGCLGKRATKKALCRNGQLNNTKDLAKEVFGFKLEEKEIHLYADNRFENCLGEQCKTLLDSCGNKWTKFTSKEEYLVDKLQFNWKKQNELMQIDLTLSSIKDKKISYHLTAYVYLLNGFTQ
ncbi:prepilin-type N-terminal cleavage/methylation domain-containing protein [Haemophilus parahaemolyticus]|uniref:prepilin-type N-terminal cleavage/methylation domain-containing protein n=1 Tax=Haemophilus parahaemolyticus TaxID=735 RepID=UPI0028E2C697|nr:prepilin-type N-terminal cleavage/methylation domain-containing protein [Haemophilus parahaemolyticus]